MSQTLKLKAPSDEELHTLLNNAEKVDSWMIRERVPSTDGPEFIEHDTEAREEAFDTIHGIRFSDAVASEVVVVQVEGQQVGEIFEQKDEDPARANLKIDPATKEQLDECKRDGETWDECLQRLAQLDRATRQ